MLRRLLASERSGVVKTFRCAIQMDTKAFAHDIETVFGFACPSTFLELHADFLAFADTSTFARKFGDAHLVTSAEDVVDLHTQCCPKQIIPFLWVQNPTARDYYGFNTSDPPRTEWPVSVFAVHTVVHGWPSFESFLNWAKA